MSKFSSPKGSRSNLKGAVRTLDDEEQIPTFEGGGAYRRDAESDLFLLAVTNMVGEDTFYEDAATRDKRFNDLVHKVTKECPEFILGTDPDAGKVGFGQYLRETMLMRSASTVLAAEYIAAGGPYGRSLVARTLQRPDEPAEILGYWLSNHGRKLPMALKRGVADAVTRMYSERSALRYDGQSRGIRMGDVIELVHPRPRGMTIAEITRELGLSGRETLDRLIDCVWWDNPGDESDREAVAEQVRTYYAQTPFAPRRFDEAAAAVLGLNDGELSARLNNTSRQSALFKFLLDSRHRGTDARLDLEHLVTIRAAKALEALPEDQRRAVLRERGPAALSEAGFSWERLSGWLPGGMDAEAWESVIPSMGVMALVRNLRNFDKVKISEAAVDAVIAKISDPEQVEKARLFPYQTWSAYKNVPSDNWGRALGKTLDLTTQNIPELDGGTLVVIDTSGSMEGTVSGKSQMRRVEVAAVMAMATWKRCKDVNVVIYGQTSAEVGIPQGTSVLSGVSQICSTIGRVGHSTYGHTAIRNHFVPGKHKRVVMFTDDQQHDSGSVNLDNVPVIYIFNLAGYAPSSLKTGAKGRYSLGGFSDGTFTAMKLLEAGRDAGWPFL